MTFPPTLFERRCCLFYVSPHACLAARRGFDKRHRLRAPPSQYFRRGGGGRHAAEIHKTYILKTMPLFDWVRARCRDISHWPSAKRRRQVLLYFTSPARRMTHKKVLMPHRAKRSGRGRRLSIISALDISPEISRHDEKQRAAHSDLHFITIDITASYYHSPTNRLLSHFRRHGLTSCASHEYH